MVTAALSSSPPFTASPNPARPNPRAMALPPKVVPAPSSFADFKTGLPQLPSAYNLFHSAQPSQG